MRFANLPYGRILVGIALTVIVAVAFVSSVRMASAGKITELENVLLQFLGIGAGAGVSWVIGDANGARSAERRMRASAKPAFRRVLQLYEGQKRIAEESALQLSVLQERAIDDKVDIHLVAAALRTIAVQATEQIGSANAAMEDWRDLAPDDVAALERQAEEKARNEGTNNVN